MASIEPIPAEPASIDAEVAALRDHPPPGGRPPRGGLLLLGRHQIGALVSTAVDFTTMVAAVELAGMPAAAATALGALCGALTNFQLGRRWIFDAQHAPVSGQAPRYAVVSAASAAWNALGVYLGHDVLGVQYVAARVLVAALVSVAWNYPLHRRFVFRSPEAMNRA